MMQTQRISEKKKKKKNIKMSATKMKALLTHRKKTSHLEEIIKIMYF